MHNFQTVHTAYDQCTVPNIHAIHTIHNLQNVLFLKTVYVVHNIKDLFTLNFVHSVHTRFVQKVSGQTTLHEVDKAYAVLTLIAFNTVPFRSYTLRPTFLPLLETFGNFSFGMSNCVFVEFRFMSSVASSKFPFRTFLSLGNRKMSHDAKSGEYGGCCK